MNKQKHNAMLYKSRKPIFYLQEICQGTAVWQAGCGTQTQNTQQRNKLKEASLLQ